MLARVDCAIAGPCLAATPPDEVPSGPTCWHVRSAHPMVEGPTGWHHTDTPIPFDSITALLAPPRNPVSRLARRGAGQLVSMGLALGQVTRLFTRGMFTNADTDTESCWGQWISLSPIGTLAGLRCW